MTTPTALTVEQARTRLPGLTLIDVRTPAEFAGGHLPGALNIPLDDLRRALPALRAAAARRDLLLVCASGRRSENACRTLAGHEVAAVTLEGGTAAWAAGGHELRRPEGPARSVWAMDRQVRFTAGALILLGFVLGLAVHPAFQILSAAVAGGLVFSALTDTCAMAAALGKLPFNRPRGTDLTATLAALREGWTADGTPR